MEHLNMTWLEFGTILACTALLDFVWGRCVKAMQDDGPTSAALWGAATTCGNAALIVSVAENYWRLVPMAIGAFLGIYIVKRVAKG